MQELSGFAPWVEVKCPTPWCLGSFGASCGSLACPGVNTTGSHLGMQFVRRLGSLRCLGVMHLARPWASQRDGNILVPVRNLVHEEFEVD